MSDPPKRLDSSLELTAIRPRPALPNADDIMLTEMLAAAERERRDLEDGTPTLDACPASGCADCATCNGRHSIECGECHEHTKECPGTCSTCTACLGVHMLSRSAYDAWRREHDPIPPSRPEAK